MAKENTLKAQVLAYFVGRAPAALTAREAENYVKCTSSKEFTHKAITSRVSELKREGKLVQVAEKFRGAGATKEEVQYRAA